MPRQLLEDIQGVFEPDLTKVTESSASPATFNGPSGTVSSITRYPGRLSRCNKVNGNNRRYGRSVWEAQVKPDSHLRQLMARGAAFGLLEHPKDGVITLASPISHVLTDVRLVEDEVHGELTVLDTEEGRKLKALVEGGYKPTVSSRGFGSLLRAADGVDDVQDDFLCEGWDVVFTPSFPDAELTVNRPAGEDVNAPLGEAKGPEGQAGKPAPVSEKVADVPAVPPAAPVQHQKHIPQSSMDKNQILNRISTLESLQPSTLDATRFAAGMQQFAAIHEDVAIYAAEDPKRSWDAQQLHNRVSAMETAWSSAVAKPSVELKRVSENQKKLTSVLKSVVETGLKYKTKLTESRTNVAKAKALVEDVAKRGRGWKTLAEKNEAKLRKLEKNYGIACEMLDTLAAQHNAGITELGRRVIELEFPEQAKEAEIAEKLKAATKPKHIAAIRESIEGKLEEAKKAAAPQDKIEESAPAPVKDEQKKDEPIGESKPESKQPEVLVIETRGVPGSVTESIGLAKRLSAHAAQLATA